MIIYYLLFSINWFYFSFSIERIYLDLALFSTFFSREVLASNQIYTGKCPHMYFLLILKDYRAIFHLEKTDLQVLFSRLSLSFTCTAFKCNSVNSPPIICTIFIAFMLVNSPRDELVVKLFKPFLWNWIRYICLLTKHLYENLFLSSNGLPVTYLDKRFRFFCFTHLDIIP